LAVGLKIGDFLEFGRRNDTDILGKFFVGDHDFVIPNLLT
jgi:hypothetical protein